MIWADDFRRRRVLDGAYISGKCVASVNVEWGSVELSNCSFIAERGR